MIYNHMWQKNIIEDFKMKNNKTLNKIYIYLLCLFILFNSSGCQSLNLFQKYKNIKNTAIDNTIVDNAKEIQTSISILKKLENKDINKVEKDISNIQANLVPRNQVHKKNISDASKSKYKYIFESVVFMGDSQAEPLSLYGFLEPTSVVAKKGRNIISAMDDIPSVVKLNPKKVVLLYGVNDLLLFKTAEDFILKYERLITKLKKQLPNAEIYVNCVYRVQDFASEKKPLFKRSDDFNKSLEILCKKLSVTYIDSNSLISNNSEYYAPDGIHFFSAYYYPWLEFMQKQLNL